MDQTKESSIRQSYSVIYDDPVALLRFVNKHCTVQLIKDSQFTGIVHSIDPISKSIILAVHQENSYQITIIPGHAIVDIYEITESHVIKAPPFREIKNTNMAANMLKRKSKVMEWLKLNLLAVTESDENIMFGNVQILPPYTATDICTDNPIVAMQVKKVLEQMPQDVS